MKVELFFVLYCLCLFSGFETQNTDGTVSCDMERLQACFMSLFDNTVSKLQRKAMPSNETFSAAVTCTYQQLESCSRSISPVYIGLVRPYVSVLQKVQSAMNQDGVAVDCSLDATLSCLRNYFTALAHGRLDFICSQSSVISKCVEPALTECSGVARYMVTMVIDELRLTYDLTCNQDNGNEDIAQKCLADAMSMIDYRVAMTMKSTLLCRNMREAKSCIQGRLQNCNPQTKHSLTRTVRVLSDMDQLVCVPRQLERMQALSCADVNSGKRTPSCDTHGFQRCLVCLQQALENPFLTQTEFRRLQDISIQCLHDNLLECRLDYCLDNLHIAMNALLSLSFINEKSESMDRNGFGLNLPTFAGMDGENSNELLEGLGLPAVFRKKRQVNEEATGENEGDGAEHTNGNQEVRWERSNETESQETGMDRSRSMQGQIMMMGIVSDLMMPEYQRSQQQVCQMVTRGYQCLRGNLQQSWVSRSQQFVIDSSLEILHNVAAELCQDEVCHTCVGLHNNEECNNQPVRACSPLQMCQTRLQDGHFFKGCVPVLTCEEQCRQSDEPCYCCRGNHCNRFSGTAWQGESCDIHKAVDAAGTLLFHSLNYTLSSSVMQENIMTLNSATSGCYSDIYQSVNQMTNIMGQYHEARDCARQQVDDFCGVPGVRSLVTMVTNPYRTPNSVDAVCRLFVSTVEEFKTKQTGVTCCENTDQTVQALFSVYNQIHQVCPDTSLLPVCESLANTGCQSASTRGNVLSLVCAELTNQIEGSLRGGVCSVTDAVDVCLRADQQFPCFSNEPGYSQLVSCLLTRTGGCSPYQMVPLTVTLVNLASRCPVPSQTVSLIMQSVWSGNQQVSWSGCLQGLKNLTSVFESGDRSHDTACIIVTMVSRCLETDGDHVYLPDVRVKMERLIQAYCIDATPSDGQCNIVALPSRVLPLLTLQLTTPLLSLTDRANMCSYQEEIVNLVTSTQGCFTLNSLLSWIQNDLQLSCEQNMVADACLVPTCDITMATNFLSQLGYYLSTSSFDTSVVCRRVETILSGVQCVTDLCTDGQVSGLNPAISYLGSLIQGRCPDVSRSLYCKGDNLETSPPTPTPVAMATTMSSGTTTAPEHPETTAATVPPYFPWTCQVEQTKWCQYVSDQPNQNDTDFCSKMAVAVDKMADCVRPLVPGCDFYHLSVVDLHYKEVFTSLNTSQCGEDFSQRLMQGATQAEQCQVPMCSFSMVQYCTNILCLEAENQTCGNLDNVLHCVSVATEGCNDLQMFALTSHLLSTMGTRLPSVCLSRVEQTADWRGMLPSNSSVAVIKCVESFQEGVTDMLNTGMGKSCGLLTDLMTCYEVALATADLPDIVRSSLDHLVTVAKPTFDLICTDEAEQSTCHHDQGRSQCVSEAAVKCMRTMSAAVLLTPTLPSDIQGAICDGLRHDGFKECFEIFSSTCPDAPHIGYQTVSNMLQLIGQLSGTCSPHPFTCTPGEAVHCISNLAEAIQEYETPDCHWDLCGTLSHTKMCIRQTTGRCDKETKASIATAFEEVSCGALTVCPQVPSLGRMQDTPDCVAAAVSSHESVCNPAQALYCLQDIYGDISDPLVSNIHKTCSAYSESLRCFFNHLSNCDDGITRIVMINLHYVTESLDSLCPSRIQASCNKDQELGCDLGQLDSCSGMVRNTGSVEDICLSLSMAKKCFHLSSVYCPRIAKLYAETKFRKLEQSTLQSQGNLRCEENLKVCGTTYLNDLERAVELVNMYINTSLSEGFRMDSGDMSCPTVQKDLMELQYLCQNKVKVMQCVLSDLDLLPTDVAVVTRNLLTEIEEKFTQICSFSVRMSAQLMDCDADCALCYLTKAGWVSDLDLLLSFSSQGLVGTVGVHSSFDFCSNYDRRMLNITEFEATAGCRGNSALQAWHQSHFEAMSQLNTDRCLAVCNTTLANICVSLFQNSIVGKTSEEICSLYNDAASCLNVAVAACETSVSSSFMNTLTGTLQLSNIVCYTLPEFQVTASAMQLSEAGVPLAVQVAMTTPVADSCQGTSCYIELDMSISPNPSSTCFSGQGAVPRILADTCSMTVTDSSASQVHTFNLQTGVNHKVDSSFVATVSVVAKLMEDGVMVATKTVQEMNINVQDTGRYGNCFLMTGSQLITFDQLSYSSFSVGEFVLYRNKLFTEKVHGGFQQCRSNSPQTCLCVVMVMSGDDVFVLDQCLRSGENSRSLEFQVYQNGDLTPDTGVYSSSSSQSYMFLLPSGTTVNVQSRGSFLSVQLQPSSIDASNTDGLCGTYDGDGGTDFTLPDGTVQTLDQIPVWEGSLLPTEFVEAWSVQGGDSLYTGTQPSIYSLPMDTTKCVCGGASSGVCVPAQLISTCDLVPAGYTATNLEPYRQNLGTSTRRKRQVEGSENDPTVSLPTWPTASGIEESEARLACQMDNLSSKELWDICNVTGVSALVESSCVTAVLLQDTLEVTREALELFKVQCKAAVLADPSIADQFSMTYQELVSTLLNLTCSYDCNNQGVCVNDTCLCDAGYTGDDCSTVTSTKPILLYLSETLYSAPVTRAANDIAVSRSVSITGDMFINTTNLRCHLEKLEVSPSGFTSSGNVTTTSATYVTPQTVLCNLIGTLPLTVLHVTVSNNGQDQSNTKLLYIMQDPDCYSCIQAVGVCTTKSTSCLIEGLCYGAGEYNPNDNCSVCDPITNIWKYKPSTACPVTTTTAPTTSTTAPPSTTAAPPSTTSVPTTSAPTTAAPTTPVPATAAPTTPAPTTRAPTTPAPTTRAPTTTAAPLSSTASPTLASTAPSMSSTTSSTTSASTSTPKSTETDTLGADRDSGLSSSTITIIVIVGGAVGLLLVIAVTYVVVRMKRGSEVDRHHRRRLITRSDSPPPFSGHQNPSFRTSEKPPKMRFAPFNPKGLTGEQVYASRYIEDPSGGGHGNSMYRVNMSMYDEHQRAARSKEGKKETGHLIPRSHAEDYSFRWYDNPGEQGRVAGNRRQVNAEFTNW